eukprot:4567469-Prorocentrum_lima.AAC.1
MTWKFDTAAAQRFALKERSGTRLVMASLGLLGDSDDELDDAAGVDPDDHPEVKLGIEERESQAAVRAKARQELEAQLSNMEMRSGDYQ